MSLNVTFYIVLVHKNDMNILEWVKVSVCFFRVCFLDEVFCSLVMMCINWVIVLELLIKAVIILALYLSLLWFLMLYCVSLCSALSSRFFKNKKSLFWVLYKFYELFGNPASGVWIRVLCPETPSAPLHFYLLELFLPPPPPLLITCFILFRSPSLLRSLLSCLVHLQSFPPSPPSFPSLCPCSSFLYFLHNQILLRGALPLTALSLVFSS